MHHLILWCGFLGAWLLVAGPVYQAALELSEEETTLDRLRDKMASLPVLPRPSAWWWLLPPVRIYLGRRRREASKRQMLDQLTDEEFSALTDYVNKALGWMLVGGGGLLLAVKETYELVEGVEWPLALFWVLVVVMAGLAFGPAAARTGHDRSELAARQGRINPGA